MQYQIRRFFVTHLGNSVGVQPNIRYLLRRLARLLLKRDRPIGANACDMRELTIGW